MGTTPNFLQIERILVNALAYVARTPKSAGARLRDEVQATLTELRHVLKVTDQDYLTWRGAYHEVISSHKAIRQAYDAARNHCLEWAVEGFPDQFISYTEEEDTRDIAAKMVAFLGGLDLDAEWVAESSQLLQAAINTADQKSTQQDDALYTYRRKVQARKSGYDTAYEVACAFYRQIEDELDYGSPDYYGLTPHPL